MSLHMQEWAKAHSHTTYSILGQQSKSHRQQTPIKSIEKAKGFLQTQQWSMQPRPPPQPQTCSMKHRTQRAMQHRTQRAMQHSPSSCKDYLLDLCFHMCINNGK